MGANKRPFYRVVVADQRSPRDGRFIESIGKYHPLEDPSLINIDETRALHWLRAGAQPSGQVRNLLSKTGIWEKFVAERPGAARAGPAARPEKPATEKVSKKAATKKAAAEEVDEQRTAEAPAPPDSTPVDEPAPELDSAPAASGPDEGPEVSVAAEEEPTTG